MKQMFLYFLLDSQNRCYYIDANGGVNTTNSPFPLVNKPIGWQEIELSFDTVDKYFSNVKSLSVPLQYVLDGAQILRYLLYRGKGYEEEVYCVIGRLNTETGNHELEYRGKLDLSKAIDAEFGVTVNAKEGGFQADLDANEDVTYELPLDETNKDVIDVLFDGVDLYDAFTYESYDFTDDVVAANYNSPTLHSPVKPYVIVPLVYLNNEGDSVGIAHGDQTFEAFEDVSFLYTSANTLFENLGANVEKVVIEGTYKFSIGFDYFFGSAIEDFKAFLYVKSTTGLTSVEVASFHVDYGGSYSFSVNSTLSIPKTGKLFLVFRFPAQYTYLTVPTGGINSTLKVSFSGKQKTKISFSSRNTNSRALVLPPLAIANQIVKKWDAKYSVQSQWFAVHNNLTSTSGQALRNLDKAVLKYSFTDFWDDYCKEYCLCMTIIGNIMYIEKREIRFASNSNSIVLDLGYLADFELVPEEKNIVNTIKIGWPDQNYDERNGKYEFNSTTEEKGPVTVKKAELNLIGKARGDCYGIEFIRGKLNNKDTTDNQGDNQVFFVNIVPVTQITDTISIDFNGGTNTLTLLGRGDLVNLFSDGTVFETVTTFADSFNHFVFTVAFAVDAGGDLVITVLETGPAVTAFFPGSILFPARLKRVRYDDITGVPVPVVDGVKRSDLAGAPYNVEEMTPKRRLLNWGAWLRSVYFQLPQEKVIFQTSLKNADLLTVLNGVTISEKADVAVTRLGDPFFLNYRGKFGVNVPLTFSKKMSALNAAGVVKGIVNGTPLEFLPIGKMSSKPATNEQEKWELILSANNSLEALEILREQSLFISDGMNTLTFSILNPVHFNYYNKVLNARYKYKDLFDDWVHHRNDQFAVQPAYLQKWEFADTISLQAITNGIGQLELSIYDCKAREIDSKFFDIQVNQAVRSPAVLSQVSLSVSDYDEGTYVFVIKSGGQILLISEWQSFAQTHEGTYIIEYFNSYNKLNAYWATFKPMIRLEAKWGQETGDGISHDYKDETRLLTLGSETFTVKTLYLGEPYGIPDWMQIKQNEILRLDRCNIENTRTTCPADSKWEITKPIGYPLMFCSIDLKRSNNNFNVAVTSTGAETEAAIIYTVESEMFGQAPGLIDFEVKPG